MKHNLSEDILHSFEQYGCFCPTPRRVGQKYPYCKFTQMGDRGDFIYVNSIVLGPTLVIRSRVSHCRGVPRHCGGGGATGRRAP
jgi:hypothetical protein